MSPCSVERLCTSPLSYHPCRRLSLRHFDASFESCPKGASAIRAVKVSAIGASTWYIYGCASTRIRKRPLPYSSLSLTVLAKDCVLDSCRAMLIPEDHHRRGDNGRADRAASRFASRLVPCRRRGDFLPASAACCLTPTASLAQLADNLPEDLDLAWMDETRARQHSRCCFLACRPSGRLPRVSRRALRRPREKAAVGVVHRQVEKDRHDVLSVVNSLALRPQTKREQKSGYFKPDTITVPHVKAPCR